MIELVSGIGGILSGVVQFGLAEFAKYKHAKLNLERARLDYAHAEALHTMELELRREQWAHEAREGAADREHVEHTLQEMLLAQGDTARLAHDTAMLDRLPPTSRVLALAASVRPVVTYFTVAVTAAVLAGLCFLDQVATAYVASGELGRLTLSAWLALTGNVTAFWFSQRHAQKAFSAPL